MLSSGPPLSRLERVASHISHQHGGVALVVGCGDGIGRAIIEHLAEDPGKALKICSQSLTGSVEKFQITTYVGDNMEMLRKFSELHFSTLL